MILGAVGKKWVHACKKDISLLYGELTTIEILFETESVLFLYLAAGEQVSKADRPLERQFENPPGALLWLGDVYNSHEIDPNRRDHSIGDILWDRYRQSGAGFLNPLNGDFLCALWDEKERTLVLGRDHIGLREIFYGEDSDGLVFGSDLKSVAAVLNRSRDLNLTAMAKYLAFCYNPGTDTFFSGIKRLRPGHVLLWKNGSVLARRYWHVSFESILDAEEEEIGAMIRSGLKKAVNIRLKDKDKTGAFLSGGLDSSSIVSLLHAEHVTGLASLSYRCRGESFDESPYAKIVAKTFGSQHHIVEYKPEDVLLADEMVRLMNEPFCDVGINIASYLLAKKAEGWIQNLFTGDGGDELFAGHPVYVADHSARLVRKIPRFLLNPVFALGRLLPDSDKKKDWKVKIKRFSENFLFPEALGTHRWRVYYHPDELQDLFLPESGKEWNKEALFGDMIHYNQEADVEDPLSRSLYSDYQTVVQFYLRRMDLVRSFGLKPRMPMLDPELISFCARIPSSLKIRGFSDVKYIERIAVEPLLPHEIVHRNDKLGHSIPLKNWMRDNENVKSFIFDLLSKETLKRRGLFNTEYIERMKEEHLSKTRNHSHRLWALAVLELWLKHLENQSK